MPNAVHKFVDHNFVYQIGVPYEKPLSEELQPGIMPNPIQAHSITKSCLPQLF